MASYEQFAYVYDKLQADIPYDLYANWVMQFAPVATHPKLVDVGCGTGIMLQHFQQASYDVAGVDLSEDMLMLARERVPNIPLVCQSMAELEGFHDVDVVTIILDSLNYLQTVEEVKSTFLRVYESLKVGGQLFFDVHSLTKMHLFLASPFTYDDGDITYLWHTEEGDAPHSIIHDMTFFVAQDHVYKRFDETHYQRTYEPEQYVEWLHEVGFTTVDVTADFTFDLPDEKTERIFIRAVK